MASVKIELDLAVVQEAIKSHTVTAVSKMLEKHYDIPAMIEEYLLKESPKDDFRFVMPIFYQPPQSGNGMIEGMIKSGIQEVAQEYISAQIEKQKPSLEKAFRSMMKDSPDSLVMAFVGAMTKGLDREWSFEMETKVSVKDPPSSCDD